MPAESSPALLSVHDLAVSFQTGSGTIPALLGVSFDICAGEIVGLLGESGCGKTTTALALMRMLPPNAQIDRGAIHFNQRDLEGLAERELAKIRGAQISIVFQESVLALNPVLRIGDQVAEVLRAHPSAAGKKARKREVCELLEMVRLREVARIYSTYPHQLSGGQRQRVLIAQALVCHPALVIADEPTASLDATVQAEIIALFAELKRALKTSFLFITHNPAILSSLADRVFVMYAGKIIERGPAAQVLHAPLHPYTRALLACVPQAPASRASQSPQAHPAIPGAPPDLAQLPAGCAFEPRCAERMEVCVGQKPQAFQPQPRREVSCFKYAE